MNYQTIKLWLLICAVSVLCPNIYAQEELPLLLNIPRYGDDVASDYTISPDNKYIASCGAVFTKVFDAKTGEIIKEFKSNVQVEFTQNSKYLLLMNYDYDKISIYNTTNWELEKELSCLNENGYTLEIQSYALMENDSIVYAHTTSFVVPERLSNITFWNIFTGNIVKQIPIDKKNYFPEYENHHYYSLDYVQEYVREFIPNKQYFISSGVYRMPTRKFDNYQYFCNIFDYNQGLSVKILKNYKSPLITKDFLICLKDTVIHYAIDNKDMYSDSLIYVFDVNTFEPIKSIKTDVPNGNVISIILYKDNFILLRTKDDTVIRLLDIETGKEKFYRINEGFRRWTISKDLTKLVTLADDYKLNLYDMTKVTEINEHTNEQTLYPNPTTNELSLNVSEIPYSIEIFNTEGILITNLLNQTSEIFHYNTSNLPNGTYFLRLTSKNQNTSYKFIKE